MIIKDRFRMQVVVDPATNAPIEGATFTVYDATDTSLSTALTVTDMTDVPMTLTSGPLGIIPDFQVVGHTQILVVSDDGTVTPLDSILSFLLSVLPDPSAAENGLALMTSDGAFVLAALTGDGSIIPAAAGQSDGTVMEVLGGAWSLGAKKAPVDSPALTGSPTAPTPAPGDNDTSIATTAFVAAAVAALVASAPSTLDTLNELATALGDDPNFATTIATALGLKAPSASPALTGSPTAPTQTAGDSSTKIATTAFVRGEFSAFSTDVTKIVKITRTAYTALGTKDAHTLYLIDETA